MSFPDPIDAAAWDASCSSQGHIARSELAGVPPSGT
jgi:hypothetical protein